MTETYPEVLIDQAYDGFIESFGWVEATVSEERARDIITELELVYDEDGKELRRPTGPASRVWMYLTNPSAEYEHWSWKSCTSRRKGAVEFWKIDCTETAPKEITA